MSNIFFVVLVISLFCSFLFGVSFTGFVSWAGIYNKDSFLGDLAMWLSGIGTVGTLIFLSRQHIQNKNERKKDKQKEKEYKESKIALDLYLSTIDTLIALISNIDEKRTLVFAHFPTFCETLKKLTKGMTEDAHISSAEIKHQELIVNLQSLYFDLRVGDIFMKLDENRCISFSAVSDTFAKSSYCLVHTWLENVIPYLQSVKKPDLSYGFGKNFIKDEYLYSLMALLVSNPKKEMLSYSDVRDQFQVFNRSNPFGDSCANNEKRIIEIDNEWLIDLEEKYPLLFAHFAIKNSGLIVEKKTVDGEETIYEPKIIIHGYVPKVEVQGVELQKEQHNVWFVLKRPSKNGIKDSTLCLPLPEDLRQAKGNFIVKLNTKED